MIYGRPLVYCEVVSFIIHRNRDEFCVSHKKQTSQIHILINFYYEMLPFYNNLNFFKTKSTKMWRFCLTSRIYKYFSKVFPITFQMSCNFHVFHRKSHSTLILSHDHIYFSIPSSLSTVVLCIHLYIHIHVIIISSIHSEWAEEIIILFIFPS